MHQPLLPRELPGAARPEGGGFPHAPVRTDGDPRPRTRRAHRRSQPGQVLAVIRNAGGSVDNVDVWGRRRLAYEIRQEERGPVRRRDFTSSPEAAKELDRQLGLSEAVLRTKVPAPRRASPGRRPEAARRGPCGSQGRQRNRDRERRVAHGRRNRHHGGGQPHRGPRAALHAERARGGDFTIASTPRTFDRQANEWKDGDALFLRASVWREFAEHVAGSLTKGMRVMAQGRLRQRSYQDREGQQRTSRARGRRDRPVAPLRDRPVTRAAGGAGGGRGQVGGGNASVVRAGTAAAGTATTTAVSRTHRGRPRAASRAQTHSRTTCGAPRAARTTTRPRSDPQRSDGHTTSSSLRITMAGKSTATAGSLAARAARTRSREVEIKVGVIDYKDVATLRKFISERGKIRARRITGVSVPGAAPHRPCREERPVRWRSSPTPAPAR